MTNTQTFEEMRAWFANALMAGYDYGKGPINGDHAEYVMSKYSENDQKHPDF